MLCCCVACIRTGGSCGTKVKYVIRETTNAAYIGTVVFIFEGIRLPPFDRDKRLPISYVPTPTYEFIKRNLRNNSNNNKNDRIVMSKLISFVAHNKLAILAAN